MACGGSDCPTEKTAEPEASFDAEQRVVSLGEVVPAMVSSKPRGDAHQSGAARSASEAESWTTRQATMELCYAAAAGNLDLLQSLLDAGHQPCNSDYEGKTPLHLAASSKTNAIEVTKLLLSHRAEVNAGDRWGQTALYQAQRAKNFQVRQLLLQSGAKLQHSRLRQQAADNFWIVNRAEIQIERELSSTLKSIVHLANWRGTQVVVKCAKIDQVELVKTFKDERKKTVASVEHYIIDDTLQAMHEELLHEIELLQSFRHPDLVMFMGAILEEEESVMFITEYMAGGDLERYFMEKRRQNNGELWRPSLWQMIDWSTAIARALSFLHNCSVPVVHRDLKPLNLLLTKKLELKVTDFGISKMIPHASSASDLTHYTMTGGIGSWLYMAPEVVRHKPYDVKVDIYSFGLILYFMSSGRSPFYEFGRDPEVVLKEYIKGNEPRPRFEECAKQLQPFMCAAWHVDASQRPSAQELVRELSALQAPPAKCTCLIS
eukprot:TRINITY_DN59199_c0_g1_i1.p1 TRINITY_DN59199_c0_g1~~TRINITY_DN59199_c0_g1_i1.p1  ORF type:complete len:490 (-),score=108.77 TRINITY_DN59199_c0_g1_i1:4-1473(-)